MAINRFNCDPTLSGNLTADYTALRNDLEQAKSLAKDYQNQLCDKSNDIALLKSTLEKTAGNLEKLQAHIVALREERHRLANEVMRVVLLEGKVASLTDELNRLRESQREAKASQRESNASQREFIDVGFEDPKSLVIVPTPTEPRLFKSGQGRG